MRTASIFQTFEIAPKLAKFSFVILGEKKIAAVCNYVIKYTPDNTRFTTDANYAKKNLVFGNQESLQQP